MSIVMSEDLDFNLRLALLSGRIDRVQKALENGSDVNAENRDNGGWTPLHLAVMDSEEAIVRFLISHGANVNATDNMGRSVLYCAQKKSTPEIVAILKAAGAVL